MIVQSSGHLLEGRESKEETEKIAMLETAGSRSGGQTAGIFISSGGQSRASHGTSDNTGQAEIASNNRVVSTRTSPGLD